MQKNIIFEYAYTCTCSQITQLYIYTYVYAYKCIMYSAYAYNSARHTYTCSLNHAAALGDLASTDEVSITQTYS